MWRTARGWEVGLGNAINPPQEEHPLAKLWNAEVCGCQQPRLHVVPGIPERPFNLLANPSSVRDYEPFHILDDHVRRAHMADDLEQSRPEQIARVSNLTLADSAEALARRTAGDYVNIRRGNPKLAE
jgi:hypothetical protein